MYVVQRPHFLIFGSVSCLLGVQSLDSSGECIPEPAAAQERRATGNRTVVSGLPSAAAQLQEMHARQRALGSESDASVRAGRAAAATAVLQRAEEGPGEAASEETLLDEVGLEDGCGPWWEDFVQVRAAMMQCSQHSSEPFSCAVDTG